MIRPPVSERGFGLALIVSAAIHAALLLILLPAAAVFFPGLVPSDRDVCIEAFLVPGQLAPLGKPKAASGRKRLEADGATPVGSVPLREVPTHVTPAEKEDRDLLAEIRMPAGRSGEDRTAPVAAVPPREVPEQVEPAVKEGKQLSPEIRPLAGWRGTGHDTSELFAPAVLFPRGGDGSGSDGSGITAARRGSQDFSEGSGASAPAFRQEGTGETPQEGGGARLPQDAGAVPRYGDNARPAYPPLARLRGYQGVVVLSVEVLVDGHVGRMKIKRSTGHEILDRAALEAVRTWRFEPGRREGRAVTMSVEVPVRFVLNEDSNLVKTDDRR